VPCTNRQVFSSNLLLVDEFSIRIELDYGIIRGLREGLWD
jgi:hypothetical protein